MFTKTSFLHPKNKHNSPYNFRELIKDYPALEDFALKNEHGTETIDFSNPQAVLHLNKALLKHHYKVDEWDIPEGYLCPPIPGRADYVHYISDLLPLDNKKEVKGLDIGVGANCIYPILAAQLFNWKMVGSDIDKNAIDAALKNALPFKQNIEIRHQIANGDLFKGIIKDGEYFDFTICNPPFHESEKEATKSTLRKLKNLKDTYRYKLNFGGQANELWCNGGEALFIKRMIKQSADFKNQVGIFTTLVSKGENLKAIYKHLNKVGAVYKTIDMFRGNKKSRFVAWSFSKKEF